MKRNIWILFALLLAFAACHQADKPTVTEQLSERTDNARHLLSEAYDYTFDESLAEAEDHATQALLLSADSTLQYQAMSLLCYIYYREGDGVKLQTMIQMMPLNGYLNVMEIQQEVERHRASNHYLLFAIVIILLLIAFAGLFIWHRRRMQRLKELYQKRVTHVRKELSAPLPNDQIKAGVDVINAIINDQNISQMGKREEQAVRQTLPLTDPALEARLSKASTPLTPKETFFCIMEYYGKSDAQKARSFCCSEQAIRSTKSRLNKKIDIRLFRSDNVVETVEIPES